VHRRINGILNTKAGIQDCGGVRVVEQPQEIVLRRSHRDKKSVISNDCVVYLQELENDLSIDNDLVSFSKAINGDNSDK